MHDRTMSVLIVSTYAVTIKRAPKEGTVPERERKTASGYVTARSSRGKTKSDA